MEFGKGKKADDILKQYAETPGIILPKWAVDRNVIRCEGMEVPVPAFLNCVRRVVNSVGGLDEKNMCLNKDGIHMLRMGIYDLAASLAKENEMDRRHDDLSGQYYEIDENTFYADRRRVRGIASTINSYRIGCNNCLSGPEECSRRDAAAPLDEVIRMSKAKKRK
jgi:hypothetical protein